MGQQSAENAVPLAMTSEFEAFIRQQRAGLIGYLRRRVSSDEDAEDIVQESLIRLMRYRDKDPKEWAPLLYRIAVNVLNDRLRQLRVRHEIQCVPLEEGVHDPSSPEPGHIQRLATQQELAKLQRALLRLPERCRQIYLLNRIEGMTYPEIAEHCGIGVKAVEKQISKALALLRTSMAAVD